MKLAVVGTGLIGGAVARAARARGAADAIYGVEPNSEHAAMALEGGVVDEIVDSVPADADLIALCCPSDRVAEWAVALADHAGAVFDVGSVKAPIVGEVRSAMNGQFPARFVPSHPIAGSEKTGPAHAPLDLFSDRAVVLTPEPDTELDAVEAVRTFWKRLGGQVIQLDAHEHDRILAVTSHLPHYLAYAFMLQVSENDISLSGGGFSDFTRIAAANPEMWWRIFKMNRTALLDELSGFEANMAQLKKALEDDDDSLGMALLRKAASKRSKL